MAAAPIIRHTCGSMEHRGGETLFDFRLGCGREGPAKFLKDWNGLYKPTAIRRTIGWAGQVRFMGCWAHARRKFVDAVKVNPKDGAAIAMVTRMDALFLVDRHAREQQLSAEERGLRREHAQVWVEEIHAECGKLRAQRLPKSALGEAVNYTLNMWPKPAAVWITRKSSFPTTWPRTPCGRWRWAARTGCTGSAKSGPKVAAILSIVESCRRLGIPVKAYLLAVLPGMSQRKHSEVAPFTSRYRRHRSERV